MDKHQTGENDLADQYYERRYDDDEWTDPEPVDKPARLTMTLSVRFTAEELEAVRAMAEQLGMKPTALVRQAAVEALAENPVDRVRVANDLAKAVALMRDAQRALTITPAGHRRQAS